MPNHVQFIHRHSQDSFLRNSQLSLLLFFCKCLSQMRCSAPYLSDFCHSWSVSLHLGIGWNGRKTQFTNYLKYQVFEQYWRTPSQYIFCESLRAIFHSNHPTGCVLTSLHFQPDQVFLAHYWESHHVKRPAKVQEVTCSFSPAHKTHLPVREGEQDEITWIVLDKPTGIVAYDHTNFKVSTRRPGFILFSNCTA